ncbi:MAG: imidazole glycerol phosphate synthase subunit HisH [Aquificaceae bacterium]
MLVVVDYGMGNIRSVSKALEKVGFDVMVTSQPDLINRGEALALPGVGAFKDAITNLKRLGLYTPIVKYIESGKPFLGICLGLQLLFERSYEFGEEKGFGVFEGDVVLLPKKVKIPHIGWNQVWKKKDSKLFESINDGDYFYFVHSYHVLPRKKDIIATTTDYGVDFVSSVEYESVFAVQFHPEKSQRVGLKLLGNFKKVVYG